MEPSPLYRPVRVVDSNGWDTQRGTHRTKQVHYQLYDGTKSFVEMPEDQYTAENVQSALENAANTHAQIMSVQGPIVASGSVAQVNPWSGNG